MGDHRRPGRVLRRLRLRRAGRTWAILILGGLVTIAFGVVLCARPGIGAITLALLFGLFNLIFGIWMLAQGTEPRRTQKPLYPAPSPDQEKNPA